MAVISKKTPATIKKTEKKSAVNGLSIQVFALDGKEKASLELPKEIFGQKENKALIAQYIRVYLQNQRQGTATAKTRGEVIGSTRKIYRQKGTGGARHGSRKAPIFVGGGVAFGPTLRDYSRDMNKKQKKQALFISLSMKLKEGAVFGIDGACLDMKPRTKEVASFFESRKITNKKILVILPEMTKNGFVKSARNITNVELIQSSTVNPYAVLHHNKIIFVGDALKKLETHFLGKNENK